MAEIPQQSYIINSNEEKYVEKYMLMVFFRHTQKW